MAGALWSETVRTPSQLQSMIFPRLVALAERAWHKASFESVVDKINRERIRKMEWEAFANTLGYKELARLDKMNINYHIPVPGAKYDIDPKLHLQHEVYLKQQSSELCD